MDYDEEAEFHRREEEAELCLAALLREKEAGNLPGVYGRLGDFGEIDDKYDVCISTSCPALDSIVVDNFKTAHACLKYMDNHKIGRGSVIALDMHADLPAIYENTQRTFPENLPRLFDFITCKNEIMRRLFYAVLEDTLVVHDQEQAIRIAQGDPPYRTVNLMGDAIAPDGCGSVIFEENHFRFGRMGIKKKAAPATGDHAAAAAAPGPAGN